MVRAPGERRRIVGVTIGGADSQIMLGHVFFDEPFSRRMAQIIRDEWDLPVTRDKLWENLFIDHIDELHMVARPYPAEMIHEFDALDDLREFDPTFIENVDSLAFDNIVSALGCEKADIRDVYPLKQGLTNLSCHVRVGDGEYVYRHPGVGTENLIDRDAELAGLNIARELGLDNTFITGDPKTGWKLSHFVPDCTQLDPHESGQTRRAMEGAGPCTRRMRRSSAASTSMPNPSATRRYCASAAASSTFPASRIWPRAWSGCTISR